MSLALRPQAKFSRQQLAQFLSARQVKSADDLSDVVKTIKHALLVMNHWWEFENALLLCLCGATAEARAAASIMILLPSEDRHVGIPQVRGQLEVLQASEQMRFSPVNVQAGLTFLLKLLGTMEMGIPLGINTEEVSKLARDCIASFGDFLVRDAPDAQDGEEVVGKVSGVQAYRSILGKIVTGLAGGLEVNIDDVHDLVLFRFLAPADVMHVVIEVIDKLGKTSPPSKKPKTSGAASSTATASASSSTVAAKKSSKAKERALAMLS